MSFQNLGKMKSCIKMRRTNGGKLGAVDANHAQLVDFAATTQIKQREAYDANFLVRT